MRITLLLLVMLTAGLSAQETGDADFMEFLKADLKDPKAPPPKEPTLDAPGMLLKWKNYELAQTEKLNAEIMAARKVAEEMLGKKALAAAGAARDALLQEVERMKAIPADGPLSYADSKTGVRYQALLGAWKHTEGSYSPDFQPGGIINKKGDSDTVWHWVDEDAGVIGVGRANSNLFWMEKPGMMRAMNKNIFRFMVAKLPSTKPIITDPVILNLTATETAQRSAMASALTQQRKRVFAWLQTKVKALPSSQATDLLSEIRTLNLALDQKSGGASRLAGVWRWERVELVIEPFGIVNSTVGRKLGRWDWVNEEKTDFCVVLNGGKNAGDIYYADVPSETQTTVTVHRLMGAHINVTRTLP